MHSRRFTTSVSPQPGRVRRARSPSRQGGRVVEDAPHGGRFAARVAPSRGLEVLIGIRRVVDLRRSVQPVVDEAVPAARLRGRRDHRGVGGDPATRSVSAAARPRASNQLACLGSRATSPSNRSLNEAKNLSAMSAENTDSAGAGPGAGPACRRAASPRRGSVEHLVRCPPGGARGSSPSAPSRENRKSAGTDAAQRA